MMENPWQGGPAKRRSSSPDASPAMSMRALPSTSRKSPSMNWPGRFAAWVWAQDGSASTARRSSQPAFTSPSDAPPAPQKQVNNGRVHPLSFPPAGRLGAEIPPTGSGVSRRIWLHREPPSASRGRDVIVKPVPELRDLPRLMSRHGSELVKERHIRLSHPPLIRGGQHIARQVQLLWRHLPFLADWQDALQM